MNGNLLGVLVVTTLLTSNAAGFALAQSADSTGAAPSIPHAPAAPPP